MSVAAGAVDHWAPPEAWGRERTRAEQDQRLVEQLGYLAAASAFYRAKSAESGVALGSIRSVADLARFPFTEKSDLRASLQRHPPLGAHLAAPLGSVVQVQASSGTTGSPSYVGLTREDQHVWNELGARTLYANGLRPGDRCLHAFGMSKGFVGGLPFVQALMHLGAAVIPIGAEAGAERLLRVAGDQRPSALVGTPNFLAYLGEQAPRIIGMPADQLGVRVISTGGEPGGGIPAVRQRLESVWGASVREMLGGTDLGCLYWGECGQGDGMHLLSPDLMVAELIDPGTGAVVEPQQGAAGELVYTSLQRRASPVLRFRTRDQVVVTGTDCPCGRTGYRIRCVGRTDDMLIVRGINLFPSAIQDLVGSLRPLTTGAVQIVADFEGHSTQAPLKLLVERGEAQDPHDDPRLCDELTGGISSALNVKTAVTVRPAGSLGEPGAAKVRLVVRQA